jgi:hypothetical protein
MHGYRCWNGTFFLISGSKCVQCCYSQNDIVPLNFTSLRCKLKTCTKNPTLLVWDGFHSDANGQPKQIEVRRQVLRLLQDCSIAMVVTGAATTNSTTTNSNKNTNMDWLSDNKQRDVHRVRLERRLGKDCYGIANGSRIPFSLSLGGILS